MVKWEDIYTCDNWGEGDETVQPVECMTVGFLLEETKSMVVIGSSYDYRSERFGTIHAFPKTKPEVILIKEVRK